MAPLTTRARGGMAYGPGGLPPGRHGVRTPSRSPRQVPPGPELRATPRWETVQVMSRQLRVRAVLVAVAVGDGPAYG